MINQEKLVKFVEMKNKIIKEKTGVTYITEEDIADIREWDEEVCKKVYDELCYWINGCEIEGLTTHTCIWCHYDDIANTTFDDCDKCKYAKRHGMCYDLTSSYHKYGTPAAIQALSNKVYENMLKKIEGLFKTSSLRRARKI